MASIRTHEHMTSYKSWWIGPLTILVAVLANSLIRTIAVAFFGVSAAFHYLQIPYVIGSTIIFLLLAWLAFVIVCRFAQQPIRFYRVLALVVLCVSLLSPVMALVGLFPAPGMSLPIFWTMIIMHIVSAAIVIGLFTTRIGKQ
ncbi:MAG TPA: hypothetical protein DHW02_25025 [Ktedonobacter sp.]|nr:hypothetical protein [Ktedonobacter sp.]